MEKRGLGTSQILDGEVYEAVNLIREELDDHLAAINDNSSEVAANLALMEEVNAKVEKVAERLDQITLFLQKFDPTFESKKTFSIKPLTKKEKQVFQALYRLLHEHRAATYKQLAQRLGFTEPLVSNYIVNLVEKGVPVKKVFMDKVAHLSLEQQFMQQQAKNNIIGLNAPLTYWGFQA